MMKIHFASEPPSDTGITIHFLTSEQRTSTPVPVPEAEFGGRVNQCVLFHGERALFAGVGPAGEVNGQTLRAAAGTAARFLQGKGRAHAAVRLDAWERFAQEIAEGLLLGAYSFDAFKADAGPASPAKLNSITFIAPELDEARRLGTRGLIFAEAANHARELGNSPPNLFFPETLAKAAWQMGRDFGLGVEVFDEERLKREGFGGLVAVGGGSVHPPRLVILRHDGGTPGEAPIALVGKAITFDSGGLSIKPAAGMEEMVWDKCGGMAVMGAMQGIAKSRVERNVVAVIASAENLTGPGAYRPGDIVTAYDGKHIEINNTDAEGRVVLADAIGYARKVLGASAIIDLATLTGGCVVALGDETAGLWSSDEELGRRILAASEKAGEPMWRMPVLREHEEKIKSDIALIKNSCGRPGSPCTAAAFLKTFAEDTRWAHIDLAGPSAITKDRADLARGATGFGTRTLIELLSAWQ